MPAIIKSQPGAAAPVEADSQADGAAQFAAPPLADNHGAALAAVVRSAQQQLEAARHAWIARWEEQAVRLACQIASKCMRRELTHSPQIARALVQEALLACSQAAACQVRLHPDDLRQLDPAAGFRHRDVQVAADPQVERGGCIVTTPEGAIDLTFSAQLNRIQQELLGGEAPLDGTTGDGTTGDGTSGGVVL